MAIRTTDADGNAPKRGSKKNDSASEPSETHLGELAKLLEDEVIPRMYFAHATSGVDTEEEWERQKIPSAAILEELTQLILKGNDEVVIVYVDKLLEAGTPIESLFLHLLAPVARRLGDMWVDDEVTFTDVTIGLAKLQRLLRRHAPEFNGASTGARVSRRVLLTALAGEQHTFGVSMVGEFFRRAGWQVDDAPLVSAAEVLSAVKKNHYELVGLSISGDTRLQELTALISKVRKASANKKIGVAVGGQLFYGNDGLVNEVGADLGGDDIVATLREAERYVGQTHRDKLT